MVRIPGFHPGDPGSSPGVGIFKHIFPSGQRGQTQDLMQYASWVRIPLLPPAFLAQLVERKTFNLKVAGSNPVRGTTGFVV